MPRLTPEDVPIHYEDRGAGEVTVCIPGALGTGESDFHQQIAFFSQSGRVIAPDPRGYGQSRPPARDYPLDFYDLDADDLIALLNALEIDRFSVLGWSDGANIGSLLAIKYPARVRRLVVWAGNSFLSAQEMEAFRSIRSLASWSPRAVDAMRAVYGDELAAMWSAYVDGLETIYTNGGEIYRSRLSCIKCPTLILHGEKDPLVPAFHPEILRDEIEHSELVTIPDGKHNIHARYAPEFNRIVSGFLNREI
jgi:valacyclovir hydrolase